MGAKDEMMPTIVECPNCGQIVRSFGQSHNESNCESFKAGYDQAVADSVEQLKLMYKAGIKE